MAKMNKITRSTKKMVEVEEKKDVYILELSREEIRALELVLSRIGGSPKISARKYTDNIYRSIKGAAGHHLLSESIGQVEDNSCIMFKDKTSLDLVEKND